MFGRVVKETAVHFERERKRRIDDKFLFVTRKGQEKLEKIPGSSGT